MLYMYSIEEIWQYVPQMDGHRINCWWPTLKKIYQFFAYCNLHMSHMQNILTLCETAKVSFNHSIRISSSKLDIDMDKAPRSPSSWSGGLSIKTKLNVYLPNIQWSTENMNITSERHFKEKIKKLIGSLVDNSSKMQPGSCFPNSENKEYSFSSVVFWPLTGNLIQFSPRLLVLPPVL